jgi:hypothetical protein
MSKRRSSLNGGSRIAVTRDAATRHLNGAVGGECKVATFFDQTENLLDSQDDLDRFSNRLSVDDW